MTRSVLPIVLLLVGLLAPAPLAAAELSASRDATPRVVGPHPPVWQYNAPPQALPFSRDERAQAVWDGDECRQACQSYCTWDLNRCLYADAQGKCLTYTDGCDRSCQRMCRTRGGPFLPFE
jgi:hypothetical protein